MRITPSLCGRRPSGALQVVLSTGMPMTSLHGVSLAVPFAQPRDGKRHTGSALRRARTKPLSPAGTTPLEAQTAMSCGARLTIFMANSLQS